MTQQIVETCCPSCKSEVSQSEVQSNKCNACGASLDTPIQNASVMVDPVYLFGKTMQ